MNIRILIGMACNRQIRHQTVSSLFNLNRQDLALNIATQGYTISENRNYLATQAVKGFSHLLFIDDDMTFPPDLVDRLLMHEKDVVGVAYHPRFKVEESTVKTLDATHIITLSQETDTKKLFECEAVGTGIMLIDVNVFKNTPRPWFDTETVETGQTKMGEDWWFCREARKAGFKIWCDPTLEVGHIGDYIF